MRALASFALFACVLGLWSSAEAQVRFRRPYSPNYRLNYGFDNRSGGGCTDYNCGGACYDGHTGMDFGTPRGTEIRAAQSGRVSATYNGCANTGYVGNPCGGRCGNYVAVTHSDGSRTIYCHMQRDSLRVSTGASVSCGQVIGRSASSGSSSGPHLHLGYRPSPGAASRDVYSGRCGPSSTRWVEQRGYREAPGTSCSTCSPSAESCNGRDDDCDGRTDEGVTRSCSTACGGGREACSGGSWGACDAPTPSPERCNGRDDDCDGTPDSGDVCEIDLLHEQPAAYAAPASTDIDGDGTADVCARGFSGVRCWPSNASGWREPIAATDWSDASGWDDVTNYATLRMGDVNGDGLADVCARANAGVVCALSMGDSFAASTLWKDGLSDDSGWGQPDNYTTLRLGDVDGDGRDDLCARANAGVRCWLSDGATFATRIVGPEWSNDAGWGAARQYGTVRMADVNGDRRADLCGRTAAGFECWLSDGAGFPTRVEGPAWSDDNGWGNRQYWSTIRMLDVDGDGRDDVCARNSRDLSCHLSRGDGFGDAEIVAELSNESGWDDETNYATIRVGDFDGDGAEDLCARANAGMRCWARRDGAWAGLEGPAWADDVGWSRPRHYQTVRLADLNGDGLDDLCARAGAGWRCHLSDGAGFGDAIELGDMTNDGGWVEPRYWTTILSAGRACVSEMEICNAVDDDCDGVIDEASMPEVCNAMDDDCDGAVDEHATDELCNRLDDDCDGFVDEAACATADASSPVDTDGGVTPGRSLRGGCGCGVAGLPRTGGVLGPMILILLFVRSRQRRR